VRALEALLVFKLFYVRAVQSWMMLMMVDRVY